MTKRTGWAAPGTRSSAPARAKNKRRVGTAPSAAGAYQPTLFEAISEGHSQADLVLSHANGTWARAVATQIASVEPGTTFLAEDIVETVAEQGFATSDLRAMGGIMLGLARKGVIVRTGRVLPARTSHGSPKPEWMRGLEVA